MKATDRCDRCNAQAYVQTRHSGNAMYWCAHHYNMYEHLLAPCVVVDDRENLAVV